MSDVNPEVEASDEATGSDELSLLKQRARMMGLKISNNIGLEALKAKIKAQMEGEAAPVAPPEAPPQMQPAAPKPRTAQEVRDQLIKEATKLVRLRITNLDPKKKDLPGEIITVANKFIGTVRKFVPFGEVTENGYHVPHCIYEFLKARRFLHIRTVKDRRHGDRVETSYVPEFSLEVLPQLTQAELKKLALMQAAAAGNASE